MKRVLLLIITLSLIISGCVDQEPSSSDSTQEGQIETELIDLSDSTQQGQISTELIDLSDITGENTEFIKYYSLQPLNINVQVPQYQLPLSLDQISNYDAFSKSIPLSSEALDLLEKNGFVVINNPFDPVEDDIIPPYDILKDEEVPVFITTDSLLHLYHIQFDETLRQIEEREFYDTIWKLSEELLNESIKTYQNSDADVKEAARRNVAYFSVGLSLLKPVPEQLCPNQNEWECTDAYFSKDDLEMYSFKIPSYVIDDVEEELKLIDDHSGFVESPIFIYVENYFQYIPRGHYTRSEKLKNYFEAFMWYGRMSMLLKGSDEIAPGTTRCSDKKGFISIEDARIQTTGACLIASEFDEDQSLLDKWDRIYSVTAFYVGLSDDLGPYEYIDALNSVFGGAFEPADLNEENIGKIKDQLILSPFTPEQTDQSLNNTTVNPPPIHRGWSGWIDCLSSQRYQYQCLNNTEGFRLMGQRFIPDSYMFTNLVGIYTDVYQGNQEPFTLVISGAGRQVRGFPRGLDVMALLGSNRSIELLDGMDDSNYLYYERQYAQLKDEFDSFDAAQWNKNLYWSWLFTLKPLLDDHGEGYPTFMQTDAWKDKELTTSLASWTELRHDTILYAKQSYTGAESSAVLPSKEKPVVGYVEPVPEFYNRLLALTQMTNKGLSDMDVLDESAEYRLDNLEVILGRLVEISSDELENEELSEDDYEFIKNFGDSLSDVITDVDDKAKKTTIIADVHTDGNTKHVLEEGVGYVDLIVVAYQLPDGRILIGSGPVMSYYEFKQPMNDRLTDEAWREMLDVSPPLKPEWISYFTEV